MSSTGQMSRFTQTTKQMSNRQYSKLRPRTNTICLTGKNYKNIDEAISDTQRMIALLNRL